MKKVFAKKSRWVLSMLVCAALILATMGSSIAATTAASNDDPMSELSNFYSVRTISPEELPAGVVPTVINSDEELRDYIAHLNHTAAAIKNANGIRHESVYSEPSRAPIGILAETSKYKDHDCCGGLHYVRVRCYFTYNGTQIGSVTNVTSTNLGWTLDSSWEQQSYSYQVIDLGRTIALHTIGIMKHYLLIESKLTEISSREYDLYSEFRP